MSKRIDQTLTVICKTAAFIRAELESTDCVPPKVANSLCNKAIAETAKQYHVTPSTISSKCVREIGFKSKYDFFNALVDFITRNNKNKDKNPDRLLYALLNHDCADDGACYIERKLNSLVA